MHPFQILISYRSGRRFSARLLPFHSYSTSNQSVNLDGWFPAADH